MSYSYRDRAPPPVDAPRDELYNDSQQQREDHYENNNNILDGDEALLDLAQLEELHNEAEKMKALGNKHMATQVRQNGMEQENEKSQ